MHDRDTLHRFLFERYPIRGHIVHLDAAWRALIEHRRYPEVIRDTLGEAVVASLLLAATIKFQGVLSLQLQGNGPVHLMLAQCTSGLGVRGLARHRELSAGGSSRISDLVGEGNLTVTLETDDGAQRYQGIVPLQGSSVAEALELENLLEQAVVALHSAENRTESRGAHAREDFPQRDDQNWLRHTVVRLDGERAVEIGYRPVHLFTLSNEVQTFPPKARVY